eukprot:10046438-Alexandrium_andersonii.AAC.1
MSRSFSEPGSSGFERLKRSCTFWPLARANTRGSCGSRIGGLRIGACDFAISRFPNSGQGLLRGT